MSESKSYDSQIPLRNIDIRDSVNYKEVMKHFGLGPNGAIMSLGRMLGLHVQNLGLILLFQTRQMKHGIPSVAKLLDSKLQERNTEELMSQCILGYHIHKMLPYS